MKYGGKLYRAEITLFRWDGIRGRRNPTFPEYRPHVVVCTEMLGVSFLDGMEFGQNLVEFESIFHESVDYSELVVGAKFQIREGRNVVGEGVVV